MACRLPNDPASDPSARPSPVGTATIAITGWGFGPRSLQPLAEALAPGFPTQVLAPASLAGAGGDAQAPSPGGRFADGLARRIAGLERPPVLIGWSLGALIALETALLAPQNVAALVLIGATARFTRAPGYPPGTPARLLEAMIARLEEQPQAVVGDFIGRVFQPENVEEPERRTLEATALHLGATELTRGLRYLADTDLRADLGRIGCPALILHGDQDRIIPVAAAEFLRHGLPASSLKIIGGAGHALPLRQAGKIGAPILAFLRGLPQA